MTDSEQGRVHVVLGAGQLGMAVMDALANSNQAVTIVNSSGKVREQLPVNVSISRADLRDPDSVESITNGADIVYFCAAPPYTEWNEKFPPMIRSVLEGVGRGYAKLVFADNLYAYGPTQGAPIRESLAYSAKGKKGRTRAEVAEMLLAAHKAGKVPVTIGRASDFYGPRVISSALGDRVFIPALQGKTVSVLGDADLPHTYTYIRDFADALITLAAHDRAYGEAWHVPSPPAMSTRQWIDLIGEQVGHTLTVRSAGDTLVTVMGLFNRQIREMKEMMYEFTEPYIVDDSKFREAFGGETTDPSAAIEETLAWYRNYVKGTHECLTR